jgi:hypothetical protein
MTSSYDEAPATDKQIAYLRKLGVRVGEGVTKQEASHLIDQALRGDSHADEDEMEEQETGVIHLPRRIP